MRAAGEYVFEYAKTRNSNGVGKKTLLGWDPIALRIYNINDAARKLKMDGKAGKGDPKKVNNKYAMGSSGTVIDKINKTAQSGLFGVLDVVETLSGTDYSGPK